MQIYVWICRRRVGRFAAEQVNDKSSCIIFHPSYAAEHVGKLEGQAGEEEIKKNKDILAS